MTFYKQDKKSKEYIKANYNLNIQLKEVEKAVKSYLKDKPFNKIFNKYEIKPLVKKEINTLIDSITNKQNDKNLRGWLSVNSYCLTVNLKTYFTANEHSINIENNFSALYFNSDIFTKELNERDNTSMIEYPLKATTQAEYDEYYNKSVELHEKLENLKDEIDKLNTTVNINLKY